MSGAYCRVCVVLGIGSGAWSVNPCWCFGIDVRYKPKLDSSHRGIVKALEAAGAKVQSLASLGGGVPDLMAVRAGRVYLIECKPEGPPSVRRVRDSQVAWAERMGITVYVVSTPSEAIDILSDSSTLAG
jgi:Archaeal holliday junction resolvase (hjc)